MNRRTWLSSLGISAASGFTGLCAVTDSKPNEQTWVVSLESFRANADEMARLHSYLGGTLLPVLDRVHRGPKMFLEAIVAPHTPQALTLAAFASFDEMIEVRAKVGADAAVQRARADLQCGESQILITTPGSLPLHEAPRSSRSGIFELRSYHAPAWRERPPAGAGAAFRRAGIHPILTASAAGEHLPRFTYLIPFESLAARQDAWARLEADSDWAGPEPKVTGASIYKLAPYSPLS
jgi:hypothetical protein